MINVKKYWENSLTLSEYLKVGEDRLNDINTPEDFKNYYELGVHRSNRALKTYKTDSDLLNSFRLKNFKGKILIISEPWCGDASSTVPAVARFFEEVNIETRIFLRDQNPSLIDMFLTDGTQSIPKVLILNDHCDVTDSWGPRPEYGLELLRKFKQNPTIYPREEFYNDLQVYYAKNRGKDAINEILQLL